MIPGAQKAGTTSLWAYLCHHPQICPESFRYKNDLVKDLAHWTISYGYNDVNNFDWLFRFKKEGQLTMQSQADLFHTYYGIERLGKEQSDCKIIILLRNPIERAWSHYWHNHLTLKEGSEPLSFEEAIERPINNEEDIYHFSYLQTGLYAKHLKKWAEFFPIENILILHSQDLYDNPQDVFIQVQMWLGLDTIKISQYDTYMQGKYGKKKMPEKIRQRLREYYKEPNEELYSMLGKNFEWN
jgi:hypothetical protein